MTELVSSDVTASCGDPAWDPEFGTADVLMMLPLSRMDPRYMLRLSRRA